MSRDNPVSKRRAALLGAVALAAMLISLAWFVVPLASAPAEVSVPESAGVASASERRAMPHASAIASSVTGTLASSRTLPAPDQLGEVASETIIALASGSWDALETVFVAQGCKADAQVASMMRASLAARPARFRPADLDTLSDAELVALRSKDDAQPLASVRPRTVAMVAIAPRSPGDRAVVTERLGDVARLESILQHGGSGGVIKGDFPFSSASISAAEASGAAPGAAILLEGRSPTGTTVLLAVEFLHTGAGWVPRRVTSVTPDGNGAMFMPRM